MSKIEKSANFANAGFAELMEMAKRAQADVTRPLPQQDAETRQGRVNECPTLAEKDDKRMMRWVGRMPVRRSIPDKMMYLDGKGTRKKVHGLSRWA